MQTTMAQPVRPRTLKHILLLGAAASLLSIGAVAKESRGQFTGTIGTEKIEVAVSCDTDAKGVIFMSDKNAALEPDDLNGDGIVVVGMPTLQDDFGVALEVHFKGRKFLTSSVMDTVGLGLKVTQAGKQVIGEGSGMYIDKPVPKTPVAFTLKCN